MKRTTNFVSPRYVFTGFSGDELETDVLRQIHDMLAELKVHDLCPARNTLSELARSS